MSEMINEREKRAQITISPDYTAAVDFALEGQPIHADILGEDEGFAPTEDCVFGATELRDEQGNITKRFLKLPKKIMESHPAVIEFYDDHEKAIKVGVGAATTVLSGLVVAGSLYMKRYKKLNP